MSLTLQDLRDTDADWRRLGATEPYWGVLTEPEFKRDVMDEDIREQFYRTGRTDVARFVDLIARWTGDAPKGGRSLDFGCGVGRLTEAMAGYVDQAYGYDISDGMVQEARARSGRPTYTTILPDGPFDWINSYIVFQHIAPERGLELLKALLVRLAPGGAVSLHFATGLADGSSPPRPRRPLSHWVPKPLLRAWLWTAWFTAVMINPDTAPPRPSKLSGGSLGAVCMFGYDPAELVRTFHAHGVRDLGLAATDHGGWSGYVIVGRRAASPSA